jgi:PAS domain S-box-containing protein
LAKGDFMHFFSESDADRGRTAAVTDRDRSNPSFAEDLSNAGTDRLLRKINKLEEENGRHRQDLEIAKRREAILDAANNAARLFMEAENFREVLQEAVQRLGLAFGASRAYVVKHHESGLGENIGEILEEWMSPEAKPYLPMPVERCFSYAKNNLSFHLKKGQAVHGSISRLPVPIRKFLQNRGAVSAILVPVLLETSFWGFIGLDHHEEDKKWDQPAAGIDVLETVARMLGASIHHQQLENTLRRSREKFRIVVDNQPEIICQHLSDGTIIFVNDGFCRYFERERKALLGQNFFSLIMPDDRKALQKTLCSLQQKEVQETFEIPLSLPSGKTCWFNFSTKSLSIYEFQTVGRDISAQKQAEEALQKVLKEKEIRIEERTEEIKFLCETMIQSEKLAALGLLVSGIAHEINNPNNFITLNMEVLQEYLEEIIRLVDQNSATMKDYCYVGMSYSEFKEDLFNLLRNIQNGSKRINATVSHLREFARPENKQEKSLVILHEVVDQAVKICGAKIKKYLKRIEAEIPRDLPPLFTNPFTLEQVLINLIINAAHSADKKNAWVKVGVEPNTGRKGQLVVYVADNGCGIPEKEISRIFTPFYTTKNQGEGMGLGLFISQNMIGGLGGQLTVESELGKGSCFRIILPT